ncbi:MAG: hypothetical protein IKT46_01405 [Clostridia bacterium]|nr:hypothetical protein [Clostridia bacterium]
MKNFVRIMSAILCVCMLMPICVFGYAGNVTQNPAVNMPKGTPTLDGDIEATGVWSEAADVNDATLGRFWGLNAPTSTAKVYFAYDTTGLYFAADIYDHSIANSFVATTGYDNINNSGSSRPYGWNGDVMTLMLDPMGVFEKNTSKQTTPWYNIGIMSDNTVKVYRSQVSEKDITSSVTAKGKVTETGWCFEVCIPWSVIVADVKSLGLAVTQAQLTTISSVSRAACMYMDRYVTSSGTVDTWGRFITVCESTYDGYNGCHTNGISAKAYGLTLNHADVGHRWGDWVVTKEPTCTMMGSKVKYCSHCTEIQTSPIMPTGHSAGEPVVTDVTCTENGSVITYCTKCDAVLSEEIAEAQGHIMSDWVIITEATESSNGLKRKSCANCDYTEEEVIPALAVPYVSTSNYVMNITLADEIKDIRFAMGTYNTPAEIKAAEGNVAIDNKTLINGTVDGIYSYELAKEGEYTVWIRMKDGKEYFVHFAVDNIKTYLTSYGVKITLNDLRGDVKDFFIAKGEYKTYAEVKANYIVNVTSVKIAGKHDYTYTVSQPGIHTVLIRYTDGTSEYLYIDLTVDKPAFTPNGLQLVVSNIPDLKVIRTAYGTYNTPGDTKRAQGARNFSDKSVIKGQDPYTLQYREEGMVTVIVEYNNGYVEAYHYNVTKKKPVLAQSAGKLTFTNLDGLVNLRYAMGKYTTSSEIKNAEGSVTLKASDIDENGNIVIKGLPAGLYSFVVQYDDDSYNYYLVTVEDAFADSIEIGSNRQMLWDDTIINESDGSYSIVNGEYTRQNNVFTFNKAYESGGIVFPNIVNMPDGTYRMYYTGFSNRRRVCYLTSTDGLNWKRANLRSNTYTGESYTNIVTSELVSPSALYVFYDNNPNATEKIKGIYGQWGDGLFLEHTYNNGDYFDFYPSETKMMGRPEETGGCFFDTLNTVFWDANIGKYVSFVRGFHENGNYNLSRDYVEYNPTNLIRDTRVAYSDDCINWTIPEPIVYKDGRDIQMYANAITQYERSDGLYIGMPTHFVLDSNGDKWTDVYFMSSRDRLNWNRSSGPILAPANGQMYVYPDCGYPTAGMIQTSEREISFFMDEYDSSKKCDVLTRYTVRTDGFMAVTGSKLVTKPLIKEGNSLELNFSGQVKVTMTDASGNSVTSGWISGDEIAKTVTFDGTLASNNVILTFEMKNAKIYSFKFN